MKSIVSHRVVLYNIQSYCDTFDFDTLIIRFGNSISFSNKKNRRTWKPNVQKKALYSEVLDE